MAKEKGFYQEAGLDVTLQAYRDGLNTVDAVLSGDSTFGIGRAALIAQYAEGKEISLLAAIYQSSPHILMALASSNINSLSDFEGKRVMMHHDAFETASIDAMILSGKIDKEKLHYVKYTYNLDSLINGDVDLYAGYISNEPYLLKERGVKYKLFYPAEYGFDFYEDILFTSQKNVRLNEEMVEKFKEASLKGWRYAFNHIEESVDVILKKYNRQHKSKNALLQEAKILKKLAYYKDRMLGEIKKEKLQRIYDVYHLMGLVTKSANLDSLIFTYNQFTKEEREYLKRKKEIKICVLPDSRPYSAIEDGKYVGVGAQILELTKKEIEIKYTLVPTSSWVESLKKGENRECDLLPIAAKTPSREYFFNFTTPYHREPLVIVTKNDKSYIIDFETELDKTFSIVQGHSFIELLKRKYPSVHLVEVKNTQEGLDGVVRGKYYGHIDVLLGAAYALKNMRSSNLQIAGQFDKKVAVSFAVRKDDAMLFSIFEKLALSLKPSQLQSILNKWVQINYTQEVHFKYLNEVVILFTFILLLFLLKHYILNKKNEKLQMLQSEILKINRTLEERIAHAVADLEKAQEIAKIGSWVFEVQSKKLECSKETYRIFGLEMDANIEDTYAFFISRFHPEDRERVVAEYEESLKEQQSEHSAEHRLLLDDGSVKYVIEKTKTDFDAHGEAVISYGTIQDITESVLIKEEIRRRDNYLLQKSRLVQLGEMLSMIAHQWKQPLSAIAATQMMIKSTVELEKYNLADKGERKAFIKFLDERLDKIELYVKNLSKTIQNFSNFYKPHTKASSLNFDMVITKSFTLIDESLKAKNIVVDFDLNANVTLSLHENEFMQVILNIITNAKDQLCEKEIKNPNIEIRSFYDAKEVFLEIEDNAGGIADEDIGRVFDPYFSTKLEKNGTGLGLYMSKMIINEYHSGILEVENGKDGAIFRIKMKREEV